MYIEKQENKLIVDNKDFSVSKTLECGQLFRYFKNDENDYYVCSAGKRCRVIEYRDHVEIITAEPEYFIDYFDLHTDYSEIIDRLSEFPELKDALDFGNGIRILKQDLYETIISFIISANNNIPRIKGIIERLCKRAGEDRGEYFAFPELESLKALSIDDYRMIGCGFRDNYLYSTVRRLCSENLLDELQQSDTESARKILLSLKGIGPKVADCIILFGLHRFDTYPVDTWIFKACKTQILDTPAKVMKFFLDRYGNLAGYAQQFIFFKQRQNE